MKRAAGILTIFFLIFILSGASVAAASKRPGNVKTLKATAGEKEVKLSWSGASKATGYYVYRIDGTKLKKVGTTKKKQCVIKKLAVNRTYKFKVIAYRKVGKKTYTSAA
ncbi:MAG: fibronectin type III domain-containing protein, partial [Eubacteriales bacterium]|nr:fibronectin type III domain-containing protein [Eubacteriales bacterium]